MSRVRAYLDERWPRVNAGLGADADDAILLVAHMSDQAIVQIERLFKRYDLSVGGKPITAEAPVLFGTLHEMRARIERTGQWSGSTVHSLGPPDTERRILAYSWFVHQFYRGALLFGALDEVGRDWGDSAGDWGDATGMATYGFDLPEARLGLDLWRTGRATDRLVREALQRGKISFVPSWQVTWNVIESVRERLHWPKLPGTEAWTPPAPINWPEDT